MIRNYRLTISYDGTRYQGWEHQPGTDMTIQGKIENVLARMIVSEGQQKQKSLKESEAYDIPEVIGAGRTDAGVHAENMIANVFMDLPSMGCDEVKAYLNRYLPDDIVIKDVVIAGERFHSRYNAQGKTYRYRCYIGDEKPVFDRKYVYDIGLISRREKGLGENVPNIDKMRTAAEYLMGEHDFRSFCSNPKMKKSTVRTVDKIDIVQKGDYISFTYHGTGFLQYMVRILTGTLLEVGFEKRSPESMEALLEAKDRRLAGDTAPACGLTMVKVDYS